MTSSYPITLVTAYFQLQKAQPGHSVPKYHAWMKNFVPFIRWPLVIFCDEQSLDVLKQLRGERPAVYHVTSLEEFFVSKYQDAFRAQCANGQWLFPEQATVWNEKMNFLRRTVESNPFHSDMFFWCDVGAFRSRNGREVFRLRERIEWPDFRVCRTMFRDKSAFFSRSSFACHPPRRPDEQLGELIRFDLAPEMYWPAGTFYGGGKEALLQCWETYYQCLEQRIESGYVVGIDELILSDLCATRPDVTRLITPKDLAWGLQHGSVDSNCFHWYCLSGDKFPWGYLFNEIPFYLRRPGPVWKKVRAKLGIQSRFVPS